MVRVNFSTIKEQILCHKNKLKNHKLKYLDKNIRIELQYQDRAGASHSFYCFAPFFYFLLCSAVKREGEKVRTRKEGE